MTIHHGDLREFASEHTFDLVTGSPPYWPLGAASEAEHPQAVPAHLEVRGTVADYAKTASRILALGGVLACAQLARAMDALGDELKLIRRRDVVFKEGEPPLISLFAATRREDIPPTYEAWDRAAADRSPSRWRSPQRVLGDPAEFQISAGERGCFAW